MTDSETRSTSDIKQTIKRRDSWLRGAYILLFALIYSVAEILFWLIVVFQFGALLLTGSTNERAQYFSKSLCSYLYEILQYLSFNTESRPFPFGEWPESGAGPVIHAEAALKKKRVTKHKTSAPEG